VNKTEAELHADYERT